jgi:hypothetical protein
MTSPEQDDEDAAAVIAVLLAIADSAGGRPAPHAARSIWADPARGLERHPRASETGWWASGMPG